APHLFLNVTGNCVALLTDGTHTQSAMSAVNDGAAWTVVTTTNSPQGAYRVNVTPAFLDMTLTWDTTTTISVVSLFDIIGAAVSPFDVSSATDSINSPPNPCPHLP